MIFSFFSDYDTRDVHEEAKAGNSVQSRNTWCLSVVSRFRFLFVSFLFQHLILSLWRDVFVYVWPRRPSKRVLSVERKQPSFFQRARGWESARDRVNAWASSHGHGVFRTGSPGATMLYPPRPAGTRPAMQDTTLSDSLRHRDCFNFYLCLYMLLTTPAVKCNASRRLWAIMYADLAFFIYTLLDANRADSELPWCDYLFQLHYNVLSYRYRNCLQNSNGFLTIQLCDSICAMDILSTNALSTRLSRASDRFCILHNFFLLIYFFYMDSSCTLLSCDFTISISWHTHYASIWKESIAIKKACKFKFAYSCCMNFTYAKLNFISSIF